jgi:lipopolysaccharide export system protein LptC
MQRSGLSAWLPLVAMAALAGITFWLLQINLPSGAQTAIGAKKHTPDYFADNFAITMLDQSGVTQYRINAATMVHYEDDAATHVTEPAIRAFTPGQPTVTSTARRGVINGDSSIVDLYDNARIVREPGASDPRMEADSQHFRVFVNDDVIETEKPVKLLRGPSVTTANAMVYNNVTREMRLFGQVRGMLAASDSALGRTSSQ